MNYGHVLWPLSARGQHEGWPRSPSGHSAGPSGHSVWPVAMSPLWTWPPAVATVLVAYRLITLFDQALP
jgi:hypothetical protein